MAVRGGKEVTLGRVQTFRVSRRRALRVPQCQHDEASPVPRVLREREGQAVQHAGEVRTRWIAGTDSAAESSEPCWPPRRWPRSRAGELFEPRRGPPVEEAAPIKAHPFPLKQVRLLSGSCYTLQDRNRAYLHTLDSDRLLHTFRLTAGLASTARQLGGWERPDIELRGHFVGHYLSACGLMYSSTGDELLKSKASGHRRGAGKVPEGQRRWLAVGLSRRVHAAAEGAAAGVGALLHPAQDHGRPAGHVRALRRRAGPGHRPRPWSPGPEDGRTGSATTRWPASWRSSTAG